MPSASAFTVTVSEELAEMIREKVAAGEYASESAVVSEGLSALKERDESVEHWLRTRVAVAYDRAVTGSGATLTPSELRASLHPPAGSSSDDA